MATMPAIMDGALLLIAANEECPQPQTSEHLASLAVMGLRHIIILQNKIDIIQPNAAINQHQRIQEFIQVKRSYNHYCSIDIYPLLHYNNFVLLNYICIAEFISFN